MPTEKQQQQKHTRDHAYADRAGGSWSGVGRAGRSGQKSPPPSADPESRRPGVRDGGRVPPSPLPESYGKNRRDDSSSDGPATLVARGADGRGDLPVAVDDRQRQNRRFNSGGSSKVGGGGSVTIEDATSRKPPALENGAGSAGGGRGSLPVGGRRTHDKEMEIANEMERDLRAESTSRWTSARRSKKNTGDGGGSGHRRGAPSTSSLPPTVAVAATSVVSVVNAAGQQQSRPQDGRPAANHTGSHGAGGSSRADGSDADGGGGGVVGVLSRRGAGPAVRDGSAVASYPVYWREGCDRTATGDASGAKAPPTYKRDGEHTSVETISSNNSNKDISGSKRHSGGGAVDKGQTAACVYASGGVGGPPAYPIHAKNANSDAAPSSSGTLGANPAAARIGGAPSAYNRDTVGYPHFKRPSTSAAATAASAAAACPAKTCPPPSTDKRGRKGTGRPPAEGGGVSGSLGSLRPVAVTLREPGDVGGRGGAAEGAERGRIVGRGVTRMKAEAFRPPGESASPLEMLGEGAMGSHRIVQTAVPLSTRRVSLQILDDLSLFFVDMRATLLLRTATAGPIMDELCLKAETFEEAVVFGNPGEVVVCVPQFVKPRSALQEAGILDGDLITHINGQRISVERPEDHFWSLKPVKGVHLLDLAFLRATGESSAKGYPWHEAHAFWKSGVRRHILDDAELGPSRQWMRQAHDLRTRESIRNYRLCQEFNMQQEQDAMGEAITRSAYPRSGGAEGGTAPVAHGDTNHCSRSTGSTHKQHESHNTGNDSNNNNKGSSRNNSSIGSSNNYSGNNLGNAPNGAAPGRRGGTFVMSSSNGSSQGGPQRYPGAPPPPAGVHGPGLQQSQQHHQRQGGATSAAGLVSRPQAAPANPGATTSTSKVPVGGGGVVGGGRVGAEAAAAAAAMATGAKGGGEGGVSTTEGGGSTKRKASPSWDGGHGRGVDDGGGKTVATATTATAAAAAAVMVVARTAAATPTTTTTMAPPSPSIVGVIQQSGSGGAAGGSASFPMPSMSIVGTIPQQHQHQQRQVQMQMQMQMQQRQQQQQRQQKQQQYPIGAPGIIGVCGGGSDMSPGHYVNNDYPGQNDFLGGGIGQTFMSPSFSVARMGEGIVGAGPMPVWRPGSDAVTGVGRPGGGGGGGGGGGAGAGRTGMMMTPQQPQKHVQPQTEYYAPQPGLVPSRGGSGLVAGGAPGMWVRQPVTAGIINGGPWRPRMTISGAAPQCPGSTSPCELRSPGIAHHSQQQQQHGIVSCGGNGGGDTQFTRGRRSSSTYGNNIPSVNDLNSNSGYGGCPALTAFSGAPPGKMMAHPLPSPAANSPKGDVLTRPIRPRQVSSGFGDASRGRNTDDRRIDRASGLDKAAAAAAAVAQGRGGGEASADRDGDREPENGERWRLSCDYCAKKKTKCSGGIERCLRCRRDDQECVYSPKKRSGPPKRRRVAAVAAGKANASTAENGPVNNNNNGGAGSGGGSRGFGSGSGGFLGMTPVFSAVSPGTVRHPAAPSVCGNGGGDIVDIVGSSVLGPVVGGIGNGFFGGVGGGGGSDRRGGAVPGDHPAGAGRDGEIWDPMGFGHTGSGGWGVMMIADPGSALQRGVAAAFREASAKSGRLLILLLIDNRRVATKPFRFTEASLNLPRGGASVVGSDPRNGSGGGAGIGDGGGVAPEQAGGGKESNSSAGEQRGPFPGAVGGDSGKSGVESDGGDGEERESPREERGASDQLAMGSLEGAGKGGGEEGESAAAAAVAGQGGENSDTMPLKPSHGSRSGSGGSGYNSNSSDGGGADGLAKISTRTRNKTAAKVAAVAEAARPAEEATAATPTNAVPQTLSPLPPSADLPLRQYRQGC
ncbi:unnamed protein product [Ectocarpus sp. 4 AP-2014]